MTRENTHRLLKRQLKEHGINPEEMNDQILGFLHSVNTAYSDFNKDIEHIEHILKESSHELFKKNTELNQLNAEQEKIIEVKTRDIFSINLNLQNAEKVAGLGNFSLNIHSGEVLLSKHFCVLTGINVEKSSIAFEDLLQLFEGADELKNFISKAISNKSKIKVEPLRLVSNTEKYFLLEGEIFTYGTDELFTGILQDITEQKKREIDLSNTLQELENYKKAIDHAGIISKSDRQGKITYVNKLFQEISGYDEEELIGADHNILNSGFHRKKYFVNMWQTISTGKVWKGIIRNQKKDGAYYWVDTTIVPFISQGKVQEYISIRFDITDKILVHQKVEEQKHFYETILNSIPVDIAVFNDQHQYLFVNPIAVKNPEVRRYLIGKDDFDYCKKYNLDINMAVQRQELFDKVKSSLSATEFMDRKVLSDGKSVYNLRRFFPVLDAKKDFLYMIGFGIDITENVEQSLKIEDSLKEKEALLGEIHHRVKNNLALVLGLIEMQISKSSNDSLRIELHEVQHRISAMSLIHEKLYKSTNFAHIDMNDYLQDLVKFLGNFYGKGKNVLTHFDIDSIFVSPKHAIPLALIVNELITNCYKYAFDINEEGNIWLRLKYAEGFLSLHVEDDGPGLPAGVDVSKLNSLGFKLLNIFTKQLKGKLEINGNKGLSVNIRFGYEQENINS